MSEISEMCEDAALLANSTAYKLLLSGKIAINFCGFVLLAITYRNATKTQKFLALHSNVRLALHLHAYYIAQVIVCMCAGNSIDLYRTLLNRKDSCDYLLPFWLTYTVREGYIFGVLGQTLTFVFLSVERIVATFRKGYEHRTSKKFFAYTTLLNVVFCFAYAYVYMGYDADWSAKTQYFTQTNDQNLSRVSSFVYFIIACECLSIILYNITYLLNSRAKNKIDFGNKRINHINKTLTEKYQIDENRKVVGLLLPVCWIHFGLYLFNFCVYFILMCSSLYDNHLLMICLLEGRELLILYPLVFCYKMIRNFTRKPGTTVAARTETTDEYFNQMNALFQSTPSIRVR